VAGRFRLRPFDYQVESGRWLRASRAVCAAGGDRRRPRPRRARL